MGIPTRRLGHILMGLSLLMGSVQAQAAGFGVFTHSAYALGQANAVTASIDQPSAVFFNPALINDLSGTQVEIGTTLIAPLQTFTSAASSLKTNGVNEQFFPSTFFLTQSLSDEISVGVGAFNPFGLGTEWPETWEGRYVGTRSELTTINFNPVISWQAATNLSVAGGLTFLWLEATLQNKLNLVLLEFPAGFADGNQKFSGDGQGVGYNMGLAAKLTDRISLGLSYRSEVHITADGKVSTHLPVGTDAVAPLFPTTGGAAKITLPRQISTGIAYQISPKAIVELGLRWEEWSCFEELRIAFDRPLAGRIDKVTPRQWNNTLAVNIGGRYNVSDTYALLFGFLYEDSPVPDATFEPVIPDSQSYLYTIGMAAEYKKIKYSISYGVQVKSDRDKNNAITAGDGSTANGEYEAVAHLLGVSFSYRF